MEIFLPTLEAKIVDLIADFRFIVYAIMVAGLIGAVATERVEGIGLMRLIARATIIVAAIAYQDAWFPKIEQVFLSIAEYVNPGYNDHPTASTDTIRESTTSSGGDGLSWRKLSESFYQALVSALATVFIYLGTLITVPLLILQYVLRWLLYFITPFALAIFMVPSLTGIGIRFLQQVLAILAWPVGFALTDLVALAIWKDFTAGVSPGTATVSDSLYEPLLTLMGGILATITIVVGMVSTPVVMQMLFSQGHAFTGASADPVTIVRGTAHVLPRPETPPPPPLPPPPIL